MCLLGICLLSTPEGIIVTRLEKYPGDNAFVFFGPEQLLDVYEWKLCMTRATSVNATLTEEVKVLTLNTDLTQHETTRSALRSSHIRRQRCGFCETMAQTDRLTLSLDWSNHRCAASVILPNHKSSKASQQDAFDECHLVFQTSDVSPSSNSLFDVHGSMGKKIATEHGKKLLIHMFNTIQCLKCMV